jgi:hypothetical protein
MGNVLALWGPPGCGIHTCATFGSEGLTPQAALSIDTKVDDGMPHSGNVQTAGEGNWIDSNDLDTNSDLPPNQCVNGNANPGVITTYASSPNINPRCNLMFKLGL